MEIEFLGPLRLGGRTTSLQRRDQVLLSAMLVRAGEVMGPDELSVAMWRDTPPRSWAKLVQGSVLRVRREIGTAAIETSLAGYRLAVPRDQLDGARFEQHIERGRQLAAQGDPDRAAVAFARALELWRGRPLEVLDGWAPGQAEVARLDELRRGAEESLLDARLAAGEHREVVAAAEVRVAEEPLREHRWATLALAQYRCGRQGDALRTLNRARTVLREELGLEPSEELVDLEHAILEQDPSLAATPAPAKLDEHCPYRGLLPYDAADAESFFGRSADVADCVERLDVSPLLVVTGPSGCGKSSLVRAGLVPALRRAGRSIVVLVPGADPDGALTDAVASEPAGAVVVVDQFEEVFTLGEVGSASSGFCRRLAEYARDVAPVIVAIRADHVAALAGDDEFARLVESGLHLVKPLAGDELREAIEGPAALSGLRLEPGLVDLLVRDSEGEPGALPLLSHALVETWRRRDGRVLTVEGYRASGEIRGAVARSADRLYESLPATQRPMLRSMMLRLVSPTPDGEAFRTRVPTRSLTSDADRARVLGVLVRTRLVTMETDNVELAHEALASAWPRLRSWLDEDAAGQRRLRHLAAAADGWEALGRPAAELYRGGRLETALEWREESSPDLTDVEQAFLDASAHADASERELLAARARQQARQNRRLRTSLVVAAVLLVATMVGAALAWQQRASAQREEREAALGALVNSAAALRANRRDLAALLAAEAYRLEPSAAAESALFGAFTAAPGVVRTLHTDLDVSSVGTGTAYISSTNQLAFIDEVGAVLVVDLASGATRQLPAMVDRADFVDSYPLLVADPTGRAIAAAWRPGAYVPTPQDEATIVTVWDVESGQRRFEPVRIPYRSSSISFSNDRELLALSGGVLGLVDVLDARTGELIVEIEQPVARPSDAMWLSATAAIAFAPDDTLAVGSQAGPIRLVDPRTGDELARIDGLRETSEMALRFGDDGATLFTFGARGGMAYDVVSGEPLWREPHQGLPYCAGEAYAARLGVLLCGQASGKVTAFDLPSGLRVGRLLDFQLGGICGMSLSPDGWSLAVVGSCYTDASIVELRLDGGGAISRLALESNVGHHVRSFGDGVLVAEVSIDPRPGPQTHLIDAATGADLGHLPGVRELLATDDPGRAIAYFARDETIGWYDTTRRERVGAGVRVDRDDLVKVSTDGELVFVTLWDEIGHVVQQVDLDSGELLPPIVESREGVEVWNVAVQSGVLYTVEAGELGDRVVHRVAAHDVASGEFLSSVDGAANVAAAGGIVIVSTEDGEIREVDPITLDPVGEPFPGSTGLLETLAIDDVGHRLVALGEDEALRFYDISTRLQLGGAIDLIYDPELRNNDLVGENPAAVLSGDGMFAAADTGYGIVVWDLEPAHWSDAACEVAGRNLTRAEWDRYIGDLAPYRRTCPMFAEQA